MRMFLRKLPRKVIQQRMSLRSSTPQRRTQINLFQRLRLRTRMRNLAMLHTTFLLTPSMLSSTVLPVLIS